MYFRLKPKYCLRGWQNAAWGILKRPENNVYFITRPFFELLILCDGVTNIEGETLFKILNEELTLEGERIIEECDEPTPLDDDQYYRYYDNRYIKGAFWSITGKCNFRCRHCFMDAPGAQFGELSHEEVLDIVDQMHDCGIANVDLTGGEPLIRPDFWDIIDRILSYKMTIGQIYTNGWLVNEKFLQGLKNRGLNPEIRISFDGIGWHDWMRGVKGAEEAALRAFDLCREYGFRTAAQLCLFKGNTDVLPQTVELLSKHGVSRLKIGNLKESDLWKKNCEDNHLDWRGFLDASIAYVPKYFEQGRPLTLSLGGVGLFPSGKVKFTKEMYDSQYPANKTGKCLTCESARATCYIGADGRIFPCMSMDSAPQEIQDEFPFIQETGLKEALSSSFYLDFITRTLDDLYEINKKCDKCNYKAICGGGCRAEAAISGDFMASDPKMCILYREGYFDKAIEAVHNAIDKYEPET